MKIPTSGLRWRLKLSCPLAPLRLLIIVGHDADRLTLTNDEFGLLDLGALEKGITGISDNLSRLWEIFVAGNPANLIRDDSGFVSISNLLLLPGLVAGFIPIVTYRYYYAGSKFNLHPGRSQNAIEQPET
jgi:hypothetical protein